MEIISWNVNGVRAVIKKDFKEWAAKVNPDVLCLQETKISHDQINEEHHFSPTYHAVWNSAERRGYSGTATFTKSKDVKSVITFPYDHLNGEGRIIQTEFKDFILFNIYFPNGQRDEIRLQYKLDFYKELLDYVLLLKENTGKELIIAGDYNTAHTEIDLANPKENANYSGFLPVERKWIDAYESKGLIDIFRKLYPGEKDHYTWWTYRFHAREKNIGWRIDYFMITEGLLSRVIDCTIMKYVKGSDHCPISLILKD